MTKRTKKEWLVRSVILMSPSSIFLPAAILPIRLKTDASMPYGLIYAKEPTAATEKFIQAVKTVVSKG